MLKLLIVDDEPLAHQVLAHHCAAHCDLEIVAHCLSAEEALRWLEPASVSVSKSETKSETKPAIDVLILDIQMPVITGLDLLHNLSSQAQVIITSAHQEYALDGYAYEVADYLLKPFSEERFASALEKVRRRISAAARLQAALSEVTEAAVSPHLILKVERALRKFQLDDITCFGAYGNYVKVWQGRQMVLANASLKTIREQTSTREFIQVHKSFIVNRQKVLSIDSQHLCLNNQMRIKIGEAYKANVRAIF